MKKKKLLSVLSLASIAPTVFAVSCGAGVQPSQNTIQETYVYKPFKVTVPDELFPGVRQNPKLYDQLIKERQELDVVHEPGYLKITTKDGGFSFIVANDVMDQDCLQSEENVIKAIKMGLAEIVYSPIERVTGHYVFQVDKSSLTSNTDNPGGFNGGSSSVYVNYGNTQTFSSKMLETITAIPYEWNHSLFHNSGLLKSNFQAIDTTLELIKESKLPINMYLPLFDDSTKDLKTNNFSKESSEWVDENLSKSFNEFVDKSNYGANINYSGMPGHLDYEVAGWIRGTYKHGIQLPAEFGDYNYNSEINLLSHLASTYNFFDPKDPLQSYNIMKVWAKHIMKMGDGENLHISFTKTDSNEVALVNFMSLGTENSSSISSLQIIDKSTGKNVFNELVNHEQIPFGFNKNPFNDYEYKYVADSSYLFNDINNKSVSIKPENVTAQITLKDGTVKQLSNVKISSQEDDGRMEFNQATSTWIHIEKKKVSP